MEKQLDWKEVWHGLFRYDHYGYIWDRDNVMTFSVNDLTEENDKQMADLCSSIVAALNGEEVRKKYSGLFVKDGCDLYKGEELLGSFRGWGHLTGGLKLESVQAARVQDQLIKYVLTKISYEE